jgi:hypothetical protein
MSPEVVVRIGEDEWKSTVKYGAGRKAEWELEFMEHKIFGLDAEVRIEVKNKDDEFG